MYCGLQQEMFVCCTLNTVACTVKKKKLLKDTSLQSFHLHSSEDLSCHLLIQTLWNQVKPPSYDKSLNINEISSHENSSAPRWVQLWGIPVVQDKGGCQRPGFGVRGQCSAYSFLCPIREVRAGRALMWACSLAGWPPCCRPLFSSGLICFFSV